MQTTHKVHPDTYPDRVTSFLTYDGKTMPQRHEWDDARTPRTDCPVRFPPVREWSGSQCEKDPDNCWEDDATGEHVDAWTGVRTATCQRAGART